MRLSLRKAVPFVPRTAWDIAPSAWGGSAWRIPALGRAHELATTVGPRSCFNVSMPDPTRVAWVMYLKPGHEAAYKQKHAEIWPELVEIIRKDGIRNYSIFRHGRTPVRLLRTRRPVPRRSAA